MFCRKCGAEIKNGDFCPKCGTKITDKSEKAVECFKKPVQNTEIHKHPKA